MSYDVPQWTYDNFKSEDYLRRVVMPLEVLLTNFKRCVVRTRTYTYTHTRAYMPRIRTRVCVCPCPCACVAWRSCGLTRPAPATALAATAVGDCA